jgi:hypothetical protein
MYDDWVTLAEAERIGNLRRDANRRQDSPSE